MLFRRWAAFIVALIAIAVLAGCVPAPAAARDYPNGQAPVKALAPVYIPGNVAYLPPRAAAAWNTARQCSVRNGVDLYPNHSAHRPAATAYRFISVQRRFWVTMPRGQAAFPGTSNHGSYRRGAVDLDPGRMAPWVVRHGGHFGWAKHGDALHESWHYTYVPTRWSRPDPGVSQRYPIVRRGSGGRCQSVAVKEVQRRLGLRQDGEYGKGTAKAVRIFQRNHGLKRTGVVSAGTWNLLRKRSRGVKSNVLVRGKTAAPFAGVDVRAAQGLLNVRLRELGSDCRVAPDGVFARATERALRCWQLARGLKVTGKLGELEWRYLRQPYRRVSLAGVALVKKWEGFRARPYRDAVGIWTIGYGETLGVGPRSKPVTETEAARRLERRLNHSFGTHVNALMLPINENQFASTTSFVYNVGPGGIGPNSGVGRALRARQWRLAADRLLQWNKAGGRVLAGLTSRRREERALFLAPVINRRLDQLRARYQRVRVQIEIRRKAGRPSPAQRRLLKRLRVAIAIEAG